MRYLAKTFLFLLKWLYRFTIGPLFLIYFIPIVFFLELGFVIFYNLEKYAEESNDYDWKFEITPTFFFVLVCLRLDIAGKI